MSEKQSALTVARPDIWARALGLATGLTGYTYAHKAPLPDGTIYACGSWGYYSPSPPPPPPPPKTPEQIWQEEIDDLESDIANKRNRVERAEKEIDELNDEIDELNDEIDELTKRLNNLKKKKPKKPKLQSAPIVVVPDGAMEWLLHEVGHWIAAGAGERALPNYGLSASETGHDGDREWQAWAFEEIILAPFGSSRYFAPPTQRDGAAFSKAGPIAERHLRHIERRIEELRLPLEPWRIVWGEWVRWGSKRARKPWETES